MWQHSYEEVRRDFPRLSGPDMNGYVIRCIIDRQVQDVISTSAAAIAASGVQSVADVRARKKRLIAYSPELRAGNRALRRFLYANLYYNPGVAIMNRRACRMLREVFNAYLRDPSLLGGNAVRRVKKEGLERSVCDYLSGMTDGYLMDEYVRLFGEPAPPGR